VATGARPPPAGVVEDAFRTLQLTGADLRRLWLEQGWTLSLSGHDDEAIDVYTPASRSAVRSATP
jgi:hypothetical protein